MGVNEIGNIPELLDGLPVAVGQVAPVSRPQAELAAHQSVLAENAALRAELAATKSSRLAENTALRAELAATKSNRSVARRRAAKG